MSELLVALVTLVALVLVVLVVLVVALVAVTAVVTAVAAAWSCAWKVGMSAYSIGPLRPLDENHCHASRRDVRAVTDARDVTPAACERSHLPAVLVERDAPRREQRADRVLHDGVAARARLGDRR